MKLFQGLTSNVYRELRRDHRARAITTVAVVMAVSVLHVASGQSVEAQGSQVWDRLARCESGGNWRIETGNGFSGGLQIAHSTWRSLDGGAYASRAARATRAQQIKVAERVVARQGWSAWPACSAKLRLNSAAPRSTSRTTTANSGRQRRHGTRSRQELVHAHQKHPRNVNHRIIGGSLIVNPGDTLSGLADEKGCDWHEFYVMNLKLIGVDPNLIFPGTRLVLPRHAMR
ncbi:transglycosylase family protein [Streptomyces kronopolitis]|uniref:transglycosylase family protein n=1 Tax=Streptomyces kronopolitis TaxID=1612435 RepID=UPI003442E81C